MKGVMMKIIILIDEDYYINNQIIPSVEKIFEVLGYNKEDLIKDMGQSSLGDF